MHSRLTVPANPGNTATVREVFGVFLRLGFTAFGGPAVHIAMMERETVEQRGWLTRAAFLDALGVVQALPGPNSTELAIHLGHLRAGWRGGLAGGVAFIAPAVAMVWILSAVATMRMVQPIAAGVLWWVTPVLVAILLDSLWRFGAQAWSRGAAAIVLPVTAAAAFLVASEVGVLAIGAGAALLARRTAASPPGNGPRLAAVLAIGIPAALLAATRAPATVLPPGTWALGGYFLGPAAVTAKVEAEAAGPPTTEPPVMGEIAIIEPININLADGHFLRVGVALQLVETALKEEFEKGENAKTNDLLIAHLGGASIEELSTAEGRAKMKKELKKELKETYEGDVIDMYFTDFVMQ